MGNAQWESGNKVRITVGEQRRIIRGENRNWAITNVADCPIRSNGRDMTGKLGKTAGE